MKRSKRYLRRLVKRLLADDRGQDLVEYALLTGIVAIVSALIGQPFLDRMKGAYETRNTQINDLSVPDDPKP